MFKVIFEDYIVGKIEKYRILMVKNKAKSPFYHLCWDFGES